MFYDQTLTQLAFCQLFQSEQVTNRASADVAIIEGYSGNQKVLVKLAFNIYLVHKYYMHWQHRHARVRLGLGR